MFAIRLEKWFFRQSVTAAVVLAVSVSVSGASRVDYTNLKGFKLPNGEKVTKEEAQACLDDNQGVCESIARRCLHAGEIEAAQFFFDSASTASMGAGQVGNTSFRYGQELERAGGDGVDYALGMYKGGCEMTNFPSADACGAYGRLLEASGGDASEVHYAYRTACTLGGVACEKLSLQERIDALRRGPASILNSEGQKNELEAGLQKAPPTTAHSFMQNLATALATNGGTNTAVQATIDAQHERELQDRIAAQQAQTQAQLQEAARQLEQQRSQQAAGQQQALDLINEQRSSQARSPARQPQNSAATSMAALLGPQRADPSTQNSANPSAALDSLLGSGPTRQNAAAPSPASALDALLGSAPSVPSVPAKTDAAAQNAGRQDTSKMGFIHTACRDKFGKWTAACCKVFETQDACQKDAKGTACVDFDMNMLRALASADGTRPTCPGTE